MMTEKYDKMVKEQEKIKSVKSLLNSINGFGHLKASFLAGMITVDEFKDKALLYAVIFLVLVLAAVCITSEVINNYIQRASKHLINLISKRTKV